MLAQNSVRFDRATPEFEFKRKGKMFINEKEFVAQIEAYVQLHKSNYIDACLAYCEEHTIEPDEIKHLINKSLKSKIEADAISLNFLPKKATLNGF